jgi:hypothetical protein
MKRTSGTTDETADAGTSASSKPVHRLTMTRRVWFGVACSVPPTSERDLMHTVGVAASRAHRRRRARAAARPELDKHKACIHIIKS